MNVQDNLFEKPLIDYITVAVEYCKTLENCQGQDRKDFVEVMRKLLPMMYLKFSLLPDYEEYTGFNEPHVTEEDYDFIRYNIAKTMGEQDDFLDVFVEDFKYSDQPVLCTLSENLSDIYQCQRDFIEIVRGGHDEALRVSLHELQEQFRCSWGAKCLNSLRALHDVCFSIHND